MALQTLSVENVWPGVMAAAAISLVADITLDAAGEYGAFVLVAREAMTISHVGLGVNNVAGSPTADIRIETVVAATGVPSGTLWATDTNIVTGALSNGFALHALTASASIARGQVFCVKIAFASGTAFRILHTRGLLGIRHLGLPYLAVNTGTPAKATIETNAGAAWSVALGSSTTAFYSLWPALLPHTAAASNAFNNTNGARRGLRFQVPFKCRASGIAFFGSTEVGDYNVAIYSDAGTELSSSSTAFEGDVSLALATSGNNYCNFDNPVEISPNTWYRAVIEPSSTTNCGLSIITSAGADYMGAFPGGGNAHYTTFASAAWDDTNTTVIPVMNILIDQLDDGVSSGGGGSGVLIMRRGRR